MIKTNINAEKKFFQKLDRILVGRDTIRVHSGSVPSTDAKRFVWLPFEAKAKRYGSYDDYLIGMKGYNYHEVSHLLWSDIGMDEFLNLLEEKLKEERDLESVTLNKNVARKLVNIIEDVRVEQKFINTYPSSSKFFEKICYENIDRLGFLGAYGRKFLDFNLRKEIAREFSSRHPEIFEDVKRYLDEYIKSKTAEERINTAFKLYDIFTLYEDELISYGIRRSWKKGYKSKDLTKRKRDEIQKKLEKDVNSDELSNLTSGDLKEEEIGDKKSTEEVNSTTSKLKRVSRKEILEEKKNLADSATEKIKQEIQEEIEDDIDTIRSGGGWSPYGKGGGKEEIPTDYYTSEEDLVARKNQIKRKIEKIRAGLKSQWRRKQKKGKIDMRSTMKAQHNGSTKIFKRYHPDRGRETQLAVVLLIDKSLSMEFRLGKAFQAEWSIKKALEETDNKVSVLAFDNTQKELKDWFGKTKYNIVAGGGTNPAKALWVSHLKLQDILQYDNNLNPLVILITDAEYDPDVGYKNSPSDNIRKLRKEFGAKIAEINIKESVKTTWYRYWNKHKEIFDYAEVCKNMDNLPKLMEDILEQVEKEFLEKYSKNGRWK